MTKQQQPKPPSPASPYAGRWVARLQGRVVAQGATAEEARRAAQALRYKETPEIAYMPAFSFSPLLASIRDALPPAQPIYLVGGALRDALLGRETHDLDFVVPENGLRLARRIANALGAAFFPLDKERDTGRVILTGEDGKRTILDVAAWRASSLDLDLLARDFTVNALAFDLQSETLYDPLGGGVDVRQKRLRACGPDSLTADPIRVLRGVRLAAALGFHIAPETRQQMKQAAAGLRSVSPERVRDELFRILEGPQPATVIRALDMLGALGYILPELAALKGVEQPPPHVYDVWTHTLSTLEHLEAILAVLTPGYDPEATGDLYNGLLTLRLGRYREHLAAHFTQSLNADRSVRALLGFAALYHDIAKPQNKTIDEQGKWHFWGHDEQGAEVAVARADALHFSHPEIQRLRLIVRHHMRPHFHSRRMEAEGKAPSRRAIYRFFRDTGEAGVDVLLLALADTRATHGHTLTQEGWSAMLDICRIFLENYWEKPSETVSPPPLLNGHDLMAALSLSPGPRVGELLEAIREAQATGKIETREAAISLARNKLLEEEI
ncbi:MAG: CCA tRNA nucleotidyltransferase [Anaerolineales bacterium]